MDCRRLVTLLCDDRADCAGFPEITGSGRLRVDPTATAADDHGPATISAERRPKEGVYADEKTGARHRSAPRFAVSPLGLLPGEIPDCTCQQPHTRRVSRTAGIAIDRRSERCERRAARGASRTLGIRELRPHGSDLARG